MVRLVRVRKKPLFHLGENHNFNKLPVLLSEVGGAVLPIMDRCVFNALIR